MDTGLDCLPLDLLKETMGFLTGFDLVRVSHVNQRFYYDLLPSDSKEWQARSAPDETLLQAKARYITQRSMYFPGAAATKGNPWTMRGGAVEIAPKFKLTAHAGSFSVDLWFALLPKTGSAPGGVLLGAQDGIASFPSSTRYSHSLVHIDHAHQLFCSVLDQPPAPIKTLALQRWYHVVLTVQREKQNAMQCVYVDGELVQTSTGALHSHWAEMKHSQVGTGQIGGVKTWRPFSGVVDEVRFWDGALQTHEVRRIVKGGGGKSVLWSMRANQAKHVQGKISFMRSTRPRERLCVDRCVRRQLSNRSY